VGADFPATGDEPGVADDGFAFFDGDGPELLGDFTVKVPAGFGDAEAEGFVGAVGTGGEGVGGEDEVFAIGGLEPGHEGGEHPAGDAAALVLGRDVNGPEVEAGFITEVDGDAADGGAVFAGDEVAMGTVFAGKGEGGAGAAGVAKVGEIKGVIGEAVFAPGSHLADEGFVPGPELEAVAFDDGRVDDGSHGDAPGDWIRAGSRIASMRSSRTAKPLRS
jgi:hypothetical protein